MSGLTSPLMATLVVCAGMAAIAVPLRELTSRDHVSVAGVSGGEENSYAHGDDYGQDISGFLRIKLLAPAKSLRVSTTDGDLLWNAEHLPAGESQTEADLVLIEDSLELLVEVNFGDEGDETAFFLTVLPDGVEEQTCYAIGSGRVEEILNYEWDFY